MPTYRYKCDNCGHVEEIFCSATESSKIKTHAWEGMDCGPLIRELFAVPSQFKETGFPGNDMKKDK